MERWVWAISSLLALAHDTMTSGKEARYFELLGVRHSLSREEAAEFKSLALECIMSVGGDRDHAEVFKNLLPRDPSDLSLTEKVVLQFLGITYPHYRPQNSIFYL